MALKGSRLEPRIILDELIAKLLLARPEGAGMIRVKEAIVVEGKYDKIKLSSLVRVLS